MQTNYQRCSLPVWKPTNKQMLHIGKECTFQSQSYLALPTGNRMEITILCNTSVQEKNHSLRFTNCSTKKRSHFPYHKLIWNYDICFSFNLHKHFHWVVKVTSIISEFLSTIKSSVKPSRQPNILTNAFLYFQPNNLKNRTSRYLSNNSNSPTSLLVSIWYFSLIDKFFFS